MSVINQKEYLKKYLKIGKQPGEKKKKKKKEKTDINRLKIIDDDIDVHIQQEIQEDLTAANEDAPQIVAVIDERPISMQIDDETNRKLWVPLGGSDETKEDAKFNVGGFNLKKIEKKNDSIFGNYKLKKPSRIEQDISPPRKSRIKSDEDLTPPRRKIKEEPDLTPPRRQTDDFSPVRKRERSKSPRNINNDLSPTRKYSRKSENEHQLTVGRKIKTEPDLTPPRRQYDKDLSPVRKSNRKERSRSPKYHKNRSRWDREDSYTRKSKKYKSPDSSPARHQIKHERRSKSPRKTLSGKKAGLQDAKEIVKETEALRRRENEVFRNLTAEQSGRNAATVVRNRKEEKDPEEEARKLKEEKELKEKYDKWGKGLKQVQDENEKMAEQLYEMSKPLARYADDEDLERYLKEQEREGDPMLDYIRKKRKKKAVEEGIPEKPMYQGEFMPNRFGIKPGYRWDGVDRSNGYERRWFETQNARKAMQEEAFKWSTEDM